MEPQSHSTKLALPQRTTASSAWVTLRKSTLSSLVEGLQVHSQDLLEFQSRVLTSS